MNSLANSSLPASPTPSTSLATDDDLTELALLTDNWCYYILDRPRRDLPVLLRQPCPAASDSYGPVSIQRTSTIHPQTNVARLLWKPTGIYRQFTEEFNHAS